MPPQEDHRKRLLGKFLSLCTFKIELCVQWLWISNIFRTQNRKSGMLFVLMIGKKIVSCDSLHVCSTTRQHNLLWFWSRVIWVQLNRLAYDKEMIVIESLTMASHILTARQHDDLHSWSNLRQDDYSAAHTWPRSWLPNAFRQGPPMLPVILHNILPTTQSGHFDWSLLDCFHFLPVKQLWLDHISIGEV